MTALGGAWWPASTVCCARCGSTTSPIRRCAISSTSMLSLIEGAMEDEVPVLAMGQCFYVNGARVRAGNAQIRVVRRALTRSSSAASWPGSGSSKGVSAEELGRLHAAHERPRRRRAGTEAGGGGRGAASPHRSGDARVRSRTPRSEATTPTRTPRPDRGARARVMYRQAVRGAKAAILRTATDRPAGDPRAPARGAADRRLAA